MLTGRIPQIGAFVLKMPIASHILSKLINQEVKHFVYGMVSHTCRLYILQWVLRDPSPAKHKNLDERLTVRKA